MALINEYIDHEVKIDVCLLLAHLQVVLLDEVGCDIDFFSLLHTKAFAAKFDIEQVYEVTFFSLLLTLYFALILCRRSWVFC